MPLLNTSIEAQIETEAYAQVKFPIPHADLREATSRYLAFCALPDSYTKPLFYEAQNGKRASQVGQVVKKGKAGEDRKRYFHYRDGLPDWLIANKVKRTDELNSFLEVAEAIHEQASETMYEHMQELDESYPDLVESHFPAHGDRDFYTRFLVYHPNKDNQLARGHYDLSTLTLALAESDPGLRIGKDQKSLQPVEHIDGEAKLFLGAGWKKQYPDSPLPIGWHDAVRINQARSVGNTALQLSDDEVVRSAIVMFANPEKGVQPDELTAHTVVSA